MKISGLINQREKILSKLNTVLSICFILLDEKNNLDELQRNIEKKGELIDSFDELSESIHSLLETNKELALNENNLLVQQEEQWSFFLKKDLEFKNNFEIHLAEIKSFVKKHEMQNKIQKAYKSI